MQRDGTIAHNGKTLAPLMETVCVEAKKIVNLIWYAPAAPASLI
jgi:hypothetical protein